VKKLSFGFFLLLFVQNFSAETYSQSSAISVDSGKASYYASGLHGLPTSSGEEFDKNDFTAAHRHLPFNSIVCVTNLKNGRNAIVRINDRGPFNKRRIIDVSPSAAQKLRMVNAGVVRVRVNTLSLHDKVPLHDTLFKEDEIWNCYGNKTELTGASVYIWQTEFLKHAFYMASSLSIDYHVDSVVVHADGDLNHRRYKVIATALKDPDANELINRLKSDGFVYAKPLSKKAN
jgi:rare lipoprotein A